MLEEQARQAQLKAQVAAYDGVTAEQQPGRQRRSVGDELRTAVAKDTEFDTEKTTILAEERRDCEEKVKRGEMTPDEMDLHLSAVQASLDRHTARRQ
jgi:Arc/MetJ-type ribon-helix-helix transcriptional regulator